MKWLKKIFSSDSPNRTLHNRPTRVRLTSLHRVHLRQITNGKPGERLDIGNISTGGVLILFDQMSKSSSDVANWKIGSVIEGRLTVDQKEFTAQLQVRHANDVQAGLEFVGDNVDLKLAIESYLRVEILGLNLRQVSEKYLKPEPEGQPVWLTDGRENEIYIVTRDSKIISFQMSFLGNFVEGGLGKQTRSGVINDTDVHEGPLHKSSALVDMQFRNEAETLKYARAFLESVERLPQELRRQIEALLTSNQSG